jgi:hypothetical protein
VQVGGGNKRREWLESKLKFFKFQLGNVQGLDLESSRLGVVVF